MTVAKLINFVKFVSRASLIGAFLLLPPILEPTSGAQAAELVMFEEAGCAWCRAFDREIAPVYGKTPEGTRAPLRRVDIAKAPPPDLAFIERERLTPLFVLVDRGREIGRIRGYPGEDHFWGLLGALIKRLDESGTSGERARTFENNRRAMRQSLVLSRPGKAG